MIFFNKKPPTVNHSLADFTYEYVSKCRRSIEYKRQYRNVARHINLFEKETGIRICTDTFTEGIAEEFIVYLRKQGLMASTVKNIHQKMTTLMNKADRAGHPVNRGFQNLSVKGENACAIYLTMDELKRLNELKGLSKEAAATRDRFLVGCFTALRISDYRRITVSENFVGGFIQLKTQKTGAVVTIPIHPIVRQIIERNNGVLPNIPSQQSFGNTIKRVCKKAGITETVLWERTVGTKIVHKKMKKWELVSSHTARRTGATNMYLAGIPTARIMLLTGHATEQSFFMYIRIGREENAKTLAEHEFFK
jgi:integrase